MLKSDTLSKWLVQSLSESNNHQYRHSLLKENNIFRMEAIPELKSIINLAHEDARSHLRRLAGVSLDPLEEYNESIDPAIGYPERLNLTTLKGYFGEIFAGIIAQNFSPNGESEWEIPTFPFRFHDTAFDELERIRQNDLEEAKTIPGRPGDDFLAFKKEGDSITRTLACESKCSSKHDSGLISKAHGQISEPGIEKPVSIRQILQILSEKSDDSEVEKWILALRELLFRQEKPENYERCDLIVYVCGEKPKRKLTWMSTDIPHKNYKGKRRLESVEVHLNDVEDLIYTIYNKQKGEKSVSNIG
ncbi:hypothetical protein [Bacillus sonorensis]|uniref:hypothetical protein n=1 Tax=Bacillus sonorensis TaxID=119858 RepID=UPI00227F9A53|nr:hypothetical protein [Bacillus sonorensis]MCY8404828.1 hypothetical protein [Bacillus sonorensis]